MAVIEKIPQMTDTDLATLLTNAQRLVGSGTVAQRSAAGEVIPVVQGELAARRKARLDADREAAANAPPVRARPTAAKARRT